MKYRIIFLVSFILILFLFSCKKENADYQSAGVISGPDLAFCACCGGYFIELNDSTYHFDSLPSASEIDLTTAIFPIEVKLDWEYERKCGSIQYILIERIEQQ